MSENYDVMAGQDWEYKVLDHGFLRLVDCMPRLVPVGKTADYAVVQAARTSYGKGTKSRSKDEQLIRYMLGHQHWSPFEFAEIKLHVKLPIFVARQWIRHAGSVNEQSARYSEVEDEYFVPKQWRAQSQMNRQTSDITRQINHAPTPVEAAAFDEYHRRLDAGVSRELARTCLPVSTYTQWYWKTNLRNALHFIRLRADAAAQPEIQAYAKGVANFVSRLFPRTWEAFADHELNGLRLSQTELGWLRDGIPDGVSPRAIREFTQKRDQLFAGNHPDKD